MRCVGCEHKVKGKSLEASGPRCPNCGHRFVADPPTAGLGAALEENMTIGRTIRLRNVSRRPLSIEIDADESTPASVELAARRTQRSTSTPSRL